MTLLRWEPIIHRNPLARFNLLQRQMNNIFDNLHDGDDSQITSWSPRVNVVDFQDKIEVSAELPGMVQNDIKIELQNNVLAISGEKVRVENKDAFSHLDERLFGKFYRSFQLGPQVDSDNIKAQFSDGVLTVTLTKKEEAKPKQIEIQG